MGYDGIRGVTAVSLQANNKIKEALIRVWFPFLSHVVCCRLVKVQSANCNFRHLILLQLQTAGEKMFNVCRLRCFIKITYRTG